MNEDIIIASLKTKIEDVFNNYGMGLLTPDDIISQLISEVLTARNSLDQLSK